MPPGLIIILFVVFGVIAILAAVHGAKKERERRDALAALAGELGLSFDPSKDRSHDDLYAHFEIFRRGHSRVAFNSIGGPLTLAGRPHHCKMGDFEYKVTQSNGKSTTTHTYRFSYAILHLPWSVPDLLVRREGMFDKLAGVMGFDDIDFESAEFSRRFLVKSRDKRFAYDVITPAMMEFLMSHDPPAVDIERARLCLSDGRRRWSPEEFRSMLAWSEQFFTLWPEHVTRTLDDTAGMSGLGRRA
ncbi:MAG: hypothetical protein RBS39_03110 [Phycisphaerales bacterium]|jgi:hypothetical protein|nr:hypothetical protein [Phycisphaerales bacterium]